MEDYINEFKKAFSTESFFGTFFSIEVYQFGDSEERAEIRIRGKVTFFLGGGVEGLHISSTNIRINHPSSEYQLSKFKTLLINEIDSELFEYVKKVKTGFVKTHPNTKGMELSN